MSAALPSGRTGYRTLPEYEMDLKKLVEAHPGLVRPVVLGTSVEGRTIAGVEIAEDVARTDDGRPVHVQMGLHHVREWPSGEVVTEFALDLANGAASDAGIAGLLRRTRTFLFPVINPDGLVVVAGGRRPTTPADDDARHGRAEPGGQRRLPPQELRRRSRGGPGAAVCDEERRRPQPQLRRLLGRPGRGDSWSGQTFRGPAPFSEPEAQAVHAWSSAHQVMVLNSNHTFARDFLYQPGFNGKDEPGSRGTDASFRTRRR